MPTIAFQIDEIQRRPMAVRLVSFKLHQLRIAADLGLRIPRICVINDPDAVRVFRDSLDGDMAVKTICGGAIHKDEGVYAIYTNQPCARCALRPPLMRAPKFVHGSESEIAFLRASIYQHWVPV